MIPQLLQTFAQTFHIVLVPASKVLEKGIGLQNVLKYLNTDDGAHMLQRDCRYCRLPPQHVLFIPGGWIACIVYLTSSETKPAWAHGYSIPLFIDSFAAHQDTATTLAIRTFSESFYVSESTKFDSFKARWTVMKAFYDKIMA